MEFDTIFLPGWEEGLFPHQRSLDEEGIKGLEEERRLAYVGITRARKEARITFVANRRIYNNWQNALPSRFIDELPEENVEVASEVGLYGSQFQQLGTSAGTDRFGSGNSHTTSFVDDPTGSTRRRSGYTREGLVLEGDAITVASLGSERGLKVGLRVFHQKFGYGRILDVDGNKLEVKFEKSGTKKVIDSFVEPV